MRALAFIAFVTILASEKASAGTSMSATPVPEQEEKNWSFSISASTYIVPDDREYVQPTLTADYEWLHLETRYNYENLGTGSVWLGYNFSVGKEIVLEATPMLGGVFGQTNGIAPGYRFALSYGKLELSSEGEFVFDTGNSEDGFFYTWSELGITPVDWLRFGIAGQRTRAYQTAVDIQRGLFLGFTYKEIDLTTYVFNLDRARPTCVVSLGVSF